MTAEEYAAKRQEIRNATAHINERRIACQSAVVKARPDLYMAAAVAFHSDVEALADIALNLVDQLANHELEARTGGGK